MSKRLKLSSQFLPREHSESNHYFEDRISQLPDEILVTILSRMTLREAVQTSIISRRWKKLWTFTTGNLDFDAPVVLFKLRKDSSLALLEKERKKYSTWVNQVLKSHNGATVDGFKVCFDLDNTHKLNVDGWIDFAIQKRAMRLEVELKRMFDNHGKDLYPFPREVLGFSNIKFLRALRLCCVDVSGPVLEDILSKCPFLEALSVSWSATLLGAKVCGASSLKLKFIEIQQCRNLEYFEVSAANLMSLTYSGRNTSLRINHAPKLDCLYLGGWYCKYNFPLFSELSPIFSQIDTLVLDYGIGKVWEIPPEFPEFKILKHLELRVATKDENSLLSCISLIKACPMLHRLGVWFVWFSSEHIPRKVEKIEGEELKCLKVVEFRWFSGRTTDVELAISVLENAPNLEKIVFDPWNPYFEMERDPLEEKPLPLVDVEENRRAARECARRLAKKHSPNAKLILR